MINIIDERILELKNIISTIDADISDIKEKNPDHEMKWPRETIEKMFYLKKDRLMAESILDINESFRNLYITARGQNE